MSDEKQPIDRLMEGTRIKGESRVIPDNSPPEAVTPEQAQAVIDVVIRYAEAHAVSRNAIAKAIAVHPSTLGRVLNFNFPANWQEVVIDLDRWLEDRQKQDAAPKVTDFVWTKVALEIQTAAQVAADLKCISLVYGPTTSGIGKTMALRAIAAEKAGAVLVTVEKVAATPSGLLGAIARAMRIGDNLRSARLYQRIKERFMDTPRLLMIDQIHNLCNAKDDKPLYVLSDLHDATGAPQLWCGTSDIVAYLERGQAKGREPLAQIRRRIGMARDLTQRTREGDTGPGEPLYTVAEIRAVFARNKMRLSPDAARYLCALANLPDSGALGTCRNLVVMATRVAELSGLGTAAQITADMLKNVHKLLVSRGTLSLLEARLQEQEEAPLLKIG